jgi:hypothetical protein
VSWWIIAVQDGPHKGARFAMDVHSMRIAIPVDPRHEIVGSVEYDLWVPPSDWRNVEPELWAWHANG